jgi:ABC-type sugar transport system substrate-binding protein
MVPFAHHSAGPDRQLLPGANTWVRPYWRASILIVGFCTLFALLPGCSRNDELLPGRAMPARPSQVLSGPPLRGRQFALGVLLPAHTGLYRKVESGMAAAAADNQLRLNVRYSGDAVGNSQRQAQELLDQRVNALLIWPTDARAAHTMVPTLVAQADRGGTPVFTVGTSADHGAVAAFTLDFTPPKALPPHAPAQFGRTVVDRIAAYLRGEKLEPHIAICPIPAEGKRDGGMPETGPQSDLGTRVPGSLREGPGPGGRGKSKIQNPKSKIPQGERL